MVANRAFRAAREVTDTSAEFRVDAVFLISAENGSSVSFGELKRQAVHLCGMLGHLGLKPQDKVAFLMDNGLFTALLSLGAMCGGFVSVPLNVRAGSAQLSCMLDNCDAKVVFVENQNSTLLRDAAENVRRYFRVITVNVNGSLPELERAADNLLIPPLTGDYEALQRSSADRSLLVLPLYHINAECVTLIPTLLSGGSVVVAHRFDVSEFWDWIDNLHVTWSILVPTIISGLVDWGDPEKRRRQTALHHICFFRSSSAPLSPSLHQQFLDKLNPLLLQAMALTEGGNVFSNPLPPGKNKIGSSGLPSGFKARIVGREGTSVPSGESGGVLLCGPGLMKGYYKDSEGTAAVMDSDRWLHTGYLARQDEDGYFFVTGRSKELTIKGDVNIAPRQIDEVLESHPAVFESAAVGIADRYLGEDAVALAVLRSEVAASERELIVFCETRFGHFKAPSRIHFVKDLPKGPFGKVKRLKLLDPVVLASLMTASQQGNDSIEIDANVVKI